MTRPRRRLLLLILAIPVLNLVAALLYMAGMTWLEGEPRGFWRSLEFAAETISTTGYGADGVWQHPAMVLFVVTLQFIGVFLVFLIFPIYLIPVLEERFEARLPTRADKDLAGHVVVYRWGPPVATLVPQAEAAGLAVVVCEPEEAVARRLVEGGHRVVHGDVDGGVLEAAGLDRAKALIANGGDHENAAVILAARQAGFEGEVLALVEDPFHRRPLMLAGATVAFTPRHMLGAALAARASPRISPRVSGLQSLGRGIAVEEVRIDPDSPLAGATLGEAGVGARTGVSVIGQWVAGELRPVTGAATRLEPGAIAVVVGGERSIERFDRLCGGVQRLRRTGAFLVGGYGEVGRKVVELLREVGEETVVIDRNPAEGVDRVGDVLDPRVLEEAGAPGAQAIILALDTDAATLFAVVIAKEVAPEVPVIARVNQAENVDRTYRAGADFALSISQVAGQILARRLLGEEAVSIDPQLKVRKIAIDGLVGRAPADLDLRAKTGCSVVAVERGEQVLVDLGADFRFEAGDAVYVCGPGEKASRFEELLAS